MDEPALTIGVQLSGLARAQAEVVARRLVERGLSHSVHLEVLTETNPSTAAAHDDHIAENRAKLAHLHRMLLEAEVDVVVNRGFDLRGEIPEGLRLAAVVPRYNPYDALICPEEICFDELAEGERVGVVQLRSRGQLRNYRPDLEYELIRGDVSDWLTSLIDGRVHALVAPAAALEHLRLQERVCEIFPPELVVPAPGSGVLLCLCREEDRLTRSRLRCLHDVDTAREYTAECSVMEALGGAWEQPLGILAQTVGDELALSGVATSADGQHLCREDHLTDGSDPCRAGAELAALLLEAGALEILGREDSPRLTGVSTQDDDAEWDEEVDDILDFATSIEELEGEDPPCD
jgi:hydroxymethylbilane synthase